jgi:hypothetical protein
MLDVFGIPAIIRDEPVLRLDTVTLTQRRPKLARPDPRTQRTRIFDQFNHRLRS